MRQEFGLHKFCSEFLVNHSTGEVKEKLRCLKFSQRPDVDSSLLDCYFVWVGLDFPALQRIF